MPLSQHSEIPTANAMAGRHPPWPSRAFGDALGWLGLRPGWPWLALPAISRRQDRGRRWAGARIAIAGPLGSPKAGCGAMAGRWQPEAAGKAWARRKSGRICYRKRMPTHHGERDGPAKCSLHILMWSSLTHHSLRLAMMPPIASGSFNS